MKHYAERPLCIDEQVALLRQRGLNFADENKAYHVLSHVSYFRLKSYLTPLTSNKEQVYLDYFLAYGKLGRHDIVNY